MSIAIPILVRNDSDSDSSDGEVAKSGDSEIPMPLPMAIPKLIPTLIPISTAIVILR